MNYIEIKKDYGMEWIEAERQLAILEYENIKRLYPIKNEDKNGKDKRLD
jgi:hypothetical protein